MSIIYHYTDMSGFYNIMQSKKLWLSPANYMNDSQEIIWGVSKLEKIINEKMKGSEKTDFKNLLPIARLGYQYPYICCFSKEKDLLSQWRAYADDGCGVAIGFSKKSFCFQSNVPITNTEDKDCYALCDVEYDAKKQFKMLSELTDSNESLRNIIKASRLPFIFKHHAFKEEQEVRIIYAPNMACREGEQPKSYEKIRYRVSGGKLIPYFELELPTNCVEEIVCGPKCKVEKSVLENFIRMSGFHGASTKMSEAPYI